MTRSRKTLEIEADAGVRLSFEFEREGELILRILDAGLWESELSEIRVAKDHAVEIAGFMLEELRRVRVDADDDDAGAVE